MQTQMREPLTTTLIIELLRKLHVAFPRNIGEKNPELMAEVYRGGLRGMSGDAVRAAVDTAIQKEQYFPKVALLREVASAWEKQRTVEVRRDASWDECPICGAHAEWKPIYKQTVEPDADGKPKLAVDAEGKPVLELIGQRLHIEHHRRQHGIYDRAEQTA